MPDLARPAGVKRVVFMEIVPGDLRKFRAESNDSPSGGGARDLRFRPFEVFDEIFAKLFPGNRTEQRRRGGMTSDVEIRVGRLSWQDSRGEYQSKEATFEPPTDVRPDEG